MFIIFKFNIASAIRHFRYDIPAIRPFYISCLKTQKQQLHFVKIIFFFFNSGKARVNRAWREPVRPQGALRNRLSWNTDYTIDYNRKREPDRAR